MDEQRVSENTGSNTEAELEGVRRGDTESTRSFLLRNRALVMQTAAEIFGDNDQAIQTSRQALRKAVGLLRQGEQVQDIEAWLVKLTRRCAYESKAATLDQDAGMGISTTAQRRKKRKRRRAIKFLRMLLVCVLSLFILLLLWAILGVMSRNLLWDLPDLGYGWFNTHIIELF